MVLAIDMGNTNIVVGCIEKGKILFVERLCTDLSKTELEYAIGIKTVLELYDIKDNEIDGAIISSVVPPHTTILQTAVNKIIGKVPWLWVRELRRDSIYLWIIQRQWELTL